MRSLASCFRVYEPLNETRLAHYCSVDREITDIESLPDSWKGFSDEDWVRWPRKPPAFVGYPSICSSAARAAASSASFLEAPRPVPQTSPFTRTHTVKALRWSGPDSSVTS